MSLSEILKSRKPPSGSIIAEEKARVYIRVSHDRSAEKNLSPEVQKRQIIAHTTSKGYQIKEWYEDLAKSAFRDDDLRTEFHRMVEDAKADPETTVLVVSNYDRFSRQRGASALEEELLKYGVRIESVSEGYFDPDTESGVLLSSMTWTIAHVQSLRIRNKVIPCMKLNFSERDPETGHADKNGGWTLFGYKPFHVPTRRGGQHEQAGKLIWLLDDHEFGGVQIWEWARIMLVDWRLKEGLGYDAMAGRLTEAGVPTPAGRTLWSPSTIQGILTEATRLYQYAGYGFWNKRDYSDRHRILERDPSEWIVVENAHPAIITVEQGDAIYAMTKHQPRVKRSHKGQPSRWTLSAGLIKCGHCGENYTSTNKHGVDSYACGSHVYRRDAGCSAPMWKLERENLEQSLLDLLIERMSSAEQTLPRIVDEINAGIEQEWRALMQAADEARHKVKDLEKQLKGYYDVAAEIGLSDELKARIQEVEAVLEELRAVRIPAKPDPVDVSEIRNLAATIREAAESDDDGARGRIVRQFVIEIVADGKEGLLECRLLDPVAIESNILVAPGGVEPPPRP